MSNLLVTAVRGRRTIVKIGPWLACSVSALLWGACGETEKNSEAQPVAHGADGGSGGAASEAASTTSAGANVNSGGAAAAGPTTASTTNATTTSARFRSCWARRAA